MFYVSISISMFDIILCANNGYQALLPTLGEAQGQVEVRRKQERVRYMDIEKVDAYSGWLMTSLDVLIQNIFLCNRSRILL